MSIFNATAQTYVDNITYWPMEYRETAEFRERMAENPAARSATGRECAQTVLFLAGPESDFFYGQIIPFCRGLDGVRIGAVALCPRTGNGGGGCTASVWGVPVDVGYWHVSSVTF